MIGTITRLMSRGYGFIRDARDVDYFFHADTVTGATSFTHMEPGMRVQFYVDTAAPRPRACHVEVIETPMRSVP